MLPSPRRARKLFSVTFPDKDFENHKLMLRRSQWKEITGGCGRNWVVEWNCEIRIKETPLRENMLLLEPVNNNFFFWFGSHTEKPGKWFGSIPKMAVGDPGLNPYSGAGTWTQILPPQVSGPTTRLDYWVFWAELLSISPVEAIPLCINT